MPELPDVTVCCERLEALVVDQPLESLQLVSAFVLRTANPPLSEAVGRVVRSMRRVGKRICVELEGDLWLVVHLMVAGRLRWRRAGTRPPSRGGLAAFHFPNGTLVFTEAGKKKRASLHVLSGVSFDEVARALRERRHTLKRSLSDPTLFDGIGGAYGDEILFRAKLSPVQWSDRLPDEDVERLRLAISEVMEEWTERLRREVGGGFRACSG